MYEDRAYQATTAKRCEENWNQTAGSAGISGGNLCANQACEPETITSQTEALLKHLCVIRDSVSTMYDKLFGPRPECGNEAKCPAPDSLTAKVVTASIMAENIARDIESIRRLI